MSEPRETTLAAIRAALGRGELTAAKRGVLERRFKQPQANIVPARSALEAPERVALFIAEAERVNASTARLSGWGDVPSAVVDYLTASNLPAAIKVAPDPSLRQIPWEGAPLLSVSVGAAVDGDQASVTGAFAGIAETGTLMLLSGPESPTTLNFMPDVHLVVLPVGRVVGSYEDAFARLRLTVSKGPMPRVVNWITGPSRTADIEQTLLLGAHGPRRLHILLVDA